MNTVVCMKWGVRYGPEYVNKLYSMVRRNLTGPLRFVCFTDDETGLDEGIEPHPLPEIKLPDVIPTFSAWAKISLWQDPLIDLEGDVLFLDLDIVITDSLDSFFTYKPGKYCVIENWTQLDRNLGNTTAFRWPVGKYSYIYDNYIKDPQGYLDKYRIEQTYISREIEEMHFWPREWCVSFKVSLIPPWPQRFFREPALSEGVRLVGFTGKPDPDEAAIGKWPAPWYKKTYKYIRPATWIDKYWR